MCWKENYVKMIVVFPLFHVSVHLFTNGFWIGLFFLQSYQPLFKNLGRPWSIALLLEEELLLHASGAYMIYPTSHMGLDQWQSQEFIFGGAIYKIFCVCMKSKIVMYNTL